MVKDGTSIKAKIKEVINKSGSVLPKTGLAGSISTPAPILKGIRLSKQRYVDTKFWDDSYIIDLTPSEKLLYLYLLTSPLTNIAGIYEVTTRRIVFDTGIGLEDVRNILDKFKKDRKVYHENNWIVICNFPRYQQYDRSPKIKEGIDIILSSLPPMIKEKIDTLSIPYLYPPNYSNSNSNLNTNGDVFKDTSIEVELANLLLKTIRRRKKDFRQPSIQQWAYNIDLLLRVDNRNPDEVRRVIEWCQSDDFWQNNILSTGKLRKQYDQLSLKMDKKPKEDNKWKPF